jgi:hypothetical protein
VGTRLNHTHSALMPITAGRGRIRVRFELGFATKKPSSLDGPVLYTILTTKVLGRALPAGPGKTLGSQKFAHPLTSC